MGAKHPTLEEIQHTINAAGRLAPFLRDEWTPGSSMVQLLKLADTAGVNLTGGSGTLCELAWKHLEAIAGPTDDELDADDDSGPDP